jgi:hypothetical protein
MSHSYSTIGPARVLVMTFTSPSSLPLSRPWAGLSARRLVRPPSWFEDHQSSHPYLSFLRAFWTLTRIGGVHEKNFRPRGCTTVRRVDLDFRKHFVEGCEGFCLFLEEPPKPVLKHGVRGFAVAGEPRFAHRAMQFLLIVGQMFPFDNG